MNLENTQQQRWTKFSVRGVQEHGKCVLFREGLQKEAQVREDFIIKKVSCVYTCNTFERFDACFFRFFVCVCFFLVFLSDSAETKFTCPAVKPLTKVTLKGGLKAGDFTDTGKVGSIKECYETCCQQSTCNLAFMLGQNCFSVKCYNKDLCSTIPAQPSIFNPQIAYVWNRNEMKNGE